jgi:hypothetical protein
MKIPVNKVVPNPDQPRTVFDEDELAGLAAGGFKKPISMAVRTAARATCKACALYGEASMVTCRECPLPEFLKRLEGEK